MKPVKRSRKIANSSRASGLDRATPGAEAFRLADYPFYLMNHAAGRYNAEMAAALTAVRMDQAGWRILMILGESNPSSVSAIADAAVMKLSTTTRVVQRMQAEGLLKTALRESDNRVRDVFMTAKGEQVLARVRTVAANVFLHAASGLSAEEITVLNGFLRRIAENLSRSTFDRPDGNDAGTPAPLTENSR